jgi:hypothetical protein
MDKRKEKRVKRRFLSSVEEKPVIVVDMSQGGIQISMSSPPQNQNVNIKLQVGGKTIELQGHVRWINKTVSSQSKNNIGIAITNAPLEYLQLLKGNI